MSEDDEIPEEPLDPTTESMLRRARSDLPSAATIERGADRLVAALVTGGGSTPPKAAPPTPPGAPFGAPWLVGGAVVLAVTVGAYVVTRPSPRVPPVAPAEARPGSTTDLAPTDLAPLGPSPLEGADVPPVTADPPASPLARPPELDPSTSTHRATGVSAEADLLDRMRAATANRRLALSREHERRFPDGLLIEEREALAIEALAQLDRRDEATRRAERFRARWPRSAYIGRIETAFAGEIERGP